MVSGTFQERPHGMEAGVGIVVHTWHTPEGMAVEGTQGAGGMHGGGKSRDRADDPALREEAHTAPLVGMEFGAPR